MELIKITTEDANILETRKFFVDDIYPLAIRFISNNRALLLFKAIQNNNDIKILIQSIININSQDEYFIKKLPFFIENIPNNEARLKEYTEATSLPHINSILFLTDFSMEKFEKGIYFLSKASRKIDNSGDIEVIDLFFNRDNFIKINIFLKRLSIYDKSADFVFISNKFKNIEFVIPDNISLDASSTDFISRIICNHYTCKYGNKERFKFNYISPKINGLQLKRPLSAEKFSDLYMDDFLISDLIFFDEKLYIIYEVRSDITNEYKKTIAIILTEDLYKKTNLVDFRNNYIIERESTDENN